MVIIIKNCKNDMSLITTCSQNIDAVNVIMVLI